MQDTQSVTTPLTPTTSSIQKRAVIGIYRYGGLPDNNYSAFVGSLNGTAYDTRIVVTATSPLKPQCRGRVLQPKAQKSKISPPLKLVFATAFRDTFGRHSSSAKAYCFQQVRAYSKSHGLFLKNKASLLC